MTELKEQSQRWVWDCAFSSDSQYIITGKVLLLQINSLWTNFSHLPDAKEIRFITMPSSFLASSDNMARLWTVETGEVKREYSGHQKAVVSLAFRDDTSE